MDTNQLIAQLSSEAPDKKPLGSPWRLAAQWLAGIVMYGLVLFALIDPRPDIAIALDATPFMLELLLLVGIIATTTLSAATLAFPDHHQQPYLVRLPIAFFAMFALLMGYQLLAEPNATTLTVSECMCTLFITIYAFLPAIWLFFLMRHATSTQPAMAGSVVVLSAFSFGALMLRLSEPSDSIIHFVVFHYVPMLVAAGLGVLLGRKLLRW